MKHFNILKPRVTGLKKICLVSLAALVTAGSSVTLLPISAQAITCGSPTSPSATTNVDVQSESTYRIWSKVTAPNTSVNSYALLVDDTTCITIGNSPLVPSTPTWIGHQNGDSNSPATVTLAAGTHTLKFLGTEPGLRISQAMLTNDLECTPTGAGENCAQTPPADTQPPTSPTGVQATATSETAISLSWSASQDNVGVFAYDIYRSSGANAATKVSSVAETNYSDAALSASTTYSYYVVARDNAGNQSAASEVVTTKTLAIPQLPQGKGKLYGQIKVGRSGAQATISLPINGVTKSYQSDARGYYYITDIPAGTYSVKYQSGTSYKFVDVKIRAYADTVKDVTLSKPAPALMSLDQVITTQTLVVNLENAVLAEGATLVTQPDNTKVLQLGNAIHQPGQPVSNCIELPSACGYPDSTNTGYKPTGVTITTEGISFNRDGDFEITQAGTVIDSKHINGCVMVKAPNVTIKRSLLTNCQSYFNIRLFEDATNFTLEDTEIDGKNFDSQNAAIVDDGRGPVTIRRMYMHNVSDGPHPGENWLLEDSYITDLYACSVCHNDTIQSAGAFNVTLRHNTIVNTPEDHPSGEGGKNAVVRIATEQGPVDGFVIENNLLSGGNFAVQVREQGNGVPRNVKILGNRIVPNWRFGPYDLEGQVELSGNYRDDTNQPLNTL